jgi:hypothetical protein
MKYGVLGSTHPPGLWKLTAEGLKAYGYRADQKYICEVHEDGSFTYVDTPQPSFKWKKSTMRFGGEVGRWEPARTTPDDPAAETDY